jgi:hypothetical protein
VKRNEKILVEELQMNQENLKTEVPLKFFSVKKKVKLE